MRSATRAVSDVQAGENPRDLRVDFFRGMALLFIFIDHIPGNGLAFFTLHSFGFADAGEIFVGLAGFASYLAYAKAFRQKGTAAALARVGRRIRDLYVAHVLLLCVCVGELAIAAWTFQNPVYFEHVNLTPFNHDPAGAIWRALALVYQPGYLNILPLYMVLLAWGPVVFWLMRRHVAWALIASAAVWSLGAFGGWNFASYPVPRGWEFNPVAWQFLFTLGIIAASRMHLDELPRRSSLLFWSSVTYIIFALVVAAPWSNLPGFGQASSLADFRATISKQDLSLWRLAHIAALAYVAACVIPPRATWLSRGWASWVVNCGRHSLPVFCLGIILSMGGFIVLVEAGRGLGTVIAVNVAGCALLGLTGWMLAYLQRRRDRSRAAHGAGQRLAWLPSRL